MCSCRPTSRWARWPVTCWSRRATTASCAGATSVRISGPVRSWRSCASTAFDFVRESAQVDSRNPYNQMMALLRLLLTVLVLPALTQDAPVGDLIRKLEDDRVGAREQAQKGLAALGEAAIPALREVVDSPRSSGELKLRAAAAIRDIELAVKSAKVYREPKRLTLKADDTMLREILDEIARQAGVEIDSTTVDGPARVRFDADDLPLFQVLDLVCRDQPERTWEPRDDGSIRLMRDRHPAFPAAYAGPFRTRITAMNAIRNNDFNARSVLLTLTVQADLDRRLKPSKI